MEADGIHDLTAAYALDALDREDEQRYEEHLGRCARCQEALASLREASTALALAVESPPPPRGLRGRILEQAARERPNVVPLRRRWLAPALGTTAAVAAAAAVILALWAHSLDRSLDRERATKGRGEAVIAILANPDAERRPLRGAQGSLVVTPEGDAALAAAGLARAPAGKTYEAWVADKGRARPAGLFHGGPGNSTLRLTQRVGPRTTVMVTLERARGALQPTSKPLVVAKPS